MWFDFFQLRSDSVLWYFWELLVSEYFGSIIIEITYVLNCLFLLNITFGNMGYERAIEICELQFQVVLVLFVFAHCCLPFTCSINCHYRAFCEFHHSYLLFASYLEHWVCCISMPWIWILYVAQRCRGNSFLGLTIWSIYCVYLISSEVFFVSYYSHALLIGFIKFSDLACTP